MFDLALGAEGRRFESCHPDGESDSYESSCFFIALIFGRNGWFPSTITSTDEIIFLKLCVPNVSFAQGNVRKLTLQR